MGELGDSLARSGFFSDQHGIGVGDPYTGKNPLLDSSRNKGMQMKAFYPKTGNGPDANMDAEFRSLYVGNKFMDQSKVDRLTSRGGGETFGSKSAFKPTNPAQSAGKGKGTLFGVIGEVPLITKSTMTAEAPKRDDNRKISKNLYTNPAQQGGPGFPISCRTIGGTTNEYMRDDYQPGLALTRKMKAEAKKKIPKPFVSMGRTREYLDRSLYSYMPEGTKHATRKASNPSEKAKFQPNAGPGTTGRFDTISKIGRDYISEAEMPEHKKKTTKSVAHGKPFKSAGTLHSKYTTDVNPYLTTPMPEKPPVYVWDGEL